MILHCSDWESLKNFNMESDLIKSINQTFSLALAAASYNDMKLALSQRINDWILYDFNKLIHVLYRLDVSETKINQLLKDNRSEDASDILADLVIERELQKIEVRKKTPPPAKENEEEMW